MSQRTRSKKTRVIPTQPQTGDRVPLKEFNDLICVMDTKHPVREGPYANIEEEMCDLVAAHLGNAVKACQNVVYLKTADNRYTRATQISDIYLNAYGNTSGIAKLSCSAECSLRNAVRGAWGRISDEIDLKPISGSDFFKMIGNSIKKPKSSRWSRPFPKDPMTVLDSSETVIVRLGDLRDVSTGKPAATIDLDGDLTFKSVRHLTISFEEYSLTRTFKQRTADQQLRWHLTMASDCCGDADTKKQLTEISTEDRWKVLVHITDCDVLMAYAKSGGEPMNIRNIGRRRIVVTSGEKVGLSLGFLSSCIYHRLCDYPFLPKRYIRPTS